VPDLLAYALAAARRGWHAFPLVPGDKTPAVRDWEHQATTDPETLTAWWQQQRFNIGLATGPSGLVVVDLDIPKPGDARPAVWALPGVTDGADVLAVLAERAGQPYPAHTFTVRTASGGTHLYFAHPEHGPELRSTRKRLGWKIDTRAHGGYVVAPGSTTPTGPYEVVSKAPVAPLPAWIADLHQPAPQPPARPLTVALRGTDRRSRYLDTAINREVATVTSAPDHHNDALYAAACALGQLVAGGELTEQEVTGRLMEAAAQVDHDPRAAARTIASGVRWGARCPRTFAA
jgi:hypothetical protein